MDWLDHRVCSSVRGLSGRRKYREKRMGQGLRRAERSEEVGRERIVLLVSTLLGHVPGASVFSAFKWGHSRKYPLGTQ